MHFAEVRIRAGAFLPLRPASLPEVVGIEAVGVVTETGDGADVALLGTRVAVALVEGTGTYAEYVAAPVEQTMPVPDGVTATDAVAVGLQGALALSLLRAARPAEHEHLLIEAAGGAVGGYLVQLAREYHPGRVIATAGSPAKREHALRLGADVVIDHSDPDWPDRVPDALEGEGLGIVFESIGGPSAARLLDTLTTGTGRMVFYGMLSGEAPPITPADLLYRGLSLIGYGGRPGTGLERIKAGHAEVLDRLATGRLRPLIDSVLPLADAAKAHQRFEDHAVIGKIVLVP
jgi:NADPH:quinone reductase-like Zn-dependent oxidoreductase